ncbi:MAG: CoA ester lyase [Pseudomonadota bacterium]
MRNTLPRSYLFVPGNRPERFARAFASGAHSVILDLEDAVPADEKAAARDAIALALGAAHPPSPVLIRINGAQTEWFGDDLKLCALPGVAGVVLPKAERVEDLAQLAGAIGTLSILPLIETALGMANAAAMARAPQVQRLVFGSIDFKLDLGIEGDHEELLYFRSQLVLASRLAALPAPVDGVTVALDDETLLHCDTLRGRRLGFGAKLCIHPRQLETVHRTFLPSDEETAWARRVVAAADATNGAAVAFDGRMVDRPVILKAQQILKEAAHAVNA